MGERCRNQQPRLENHRPGRFDSQRERRNLRRMDNQCCRRKWPVFRYGTEECRRKRNNALFGLLLAELGRPPCFGALLFRLVCVWRCGVCECVLRCLVLEFGLRFASHIQERKYYIMALGRDVSQVQPIEECTLPLGKKQIGLCCVVG